MASDWTTCTFVWLRRSGLIWRLSSCAGSLLARFDDFRVFELFKQAPQAAVFELFKQAPQAAAKANKPPGTRQRTERG